MNEREALKLALEALDCIYSPLHVREINKVGAAMTAIREALAQPKQEPVIGTKTWFEDGKVVTQHLTAKDIYKEPEQELVGEVLDERDEVDWISFVPPVGTPIYTTPPHRKPLTDEEIFDCENSIPDEAVTDRDWCIHFARAIEAAHGIKEKK